MSIRTAIEWADSTANYWEGCTQISPGCDGCYAMTRAARYGSVEWNGPPRRVAAGAQVARAAQRIAKRTGVKQVVFVNSLSDFFDKLAPDVWRVDALNEMRDAPDCVFLILTKRVGNVLGMMRKLEATYGPNYWPANAWLGISVVNQAEANRDIPKALEAKAALAIPRLFLSVEPMLGEVDLERGGFSFLRKLTSPTGKKYDKVDWVICGGESGKDARPMHPDWPRSLRDQCADAGVPFMFKQWGEWVPGGHPAAIALGDFTMRNAMALSTKGGEFPDGQSVWHVGKKAAGRLLDGVEHNGRPQL